MHMRTKKWARPELAACPFFTEFTQGGEEWRNRWKSRFPRPDRPLHLEMGCGKAVSSAAMIADNPEINYVIVDISSDVLGVARRNLVRACGAGVSNCQILLSDICLIDRIFGPEDLAERIYIHFPNPWTEKPKQAKRRLTHPRQLLQYRSFLSPGGEIWFKTDDDTLFQDSRVYFELCGFENVFLTENLHESGFTPNYLSEHEIKFTAQGLPIRFGIFRKTEREPDFDPTRFRLTPGLRRAVLERLDPRGNGTGTSGDAAKE